MDRFDLASVTENIQTPINQTQQFYMGTHSTLHEEDRNTTHQGTSVCIEFIRDLTLLGGDMMLLRLCPLRRSQAKVKTR